MSVFQLVFLCVVVVVSSFFYLSLFEHTMIQWVHIWWTNQRNFQQQLNSNSTSDSKTHRHIPFALWFLLYKRKPIELRLSPRVVCCKWDEYLFALWLWLWSILKHIATLSLLMNKMKRRKEGGKHGKKCDNRMAHLPYNPRAQLNLCVVIFCYLQVYLKCVCAPTKYIEHTMGLVTF